VCKQHKQMLLNAVVGILSSAAEGVVQVVLALLG
jgi:hypothetical protein